METRNSRVAVTRTHSRGCLPPVREGARTRGVEGWGVCRQADGGRESLTCGAPGNSRTAAAQVRTRGRASAGHSTWSSRVGAARRARLPLQPAPSLAPETRRGAGGRSCSTVAWATTPRSRPRLGRLLRGGVSAGAVFPAPQRCPGPAACLRLSPRGARGLRSPFPARDLQTGVAVLSTCCPVRVHWLNTG